MIHKLSFWFRPNKVPLLNRETWARFLTKRWAFRVKSTNLRICWWQRNKIRDEKRDISLTELSQQTTKSFRVDVRDEWGIIVVVVLQQETFFNSFKSFFRELCGSWQITSGFRLPSKWSLIFINLENEHRNGKDFEISNQW